MKKKFFKAFSLLMAMVFCFSMVGTAFAAKSAAGGGGARPTTGVIAGTIVDSATLAPIAGAQIQLEKSGVIYYTLFTDANGTFNATVAKGTWGVKASADGYYANEAEALVVGGETTEVTVALNAIAGGTLDGAVTSKGGGPVIGATITVADRVLVTDEHGNFFAENIAPGTYVATVAADHYVGQTTTVEIVAGEVAFIDFTLLLDAPAFAGKVKDAVALQPIANAQVWAVDEAGVVYGPVYTDNLGNYTIWDLSGVQQNYTVYCSAAGYADANIIAMSRLDGTAQTVFFDLLAL